MPGKIFIGSSSLSLFVKRKFSNVEPIWWRCSNIDRTHDGRALEIQLRLEFVQVYYGKGSIENSGFAGLRNIE